MAAASPAGRTLQLLDSTTSVPAPRCRTCSTTVARYSFPPPGSWKWWPRESYCPWPAHRKTSPSRSVQAKLSRARKMLSSETSEPERVRKFRWFDPTED